ncbi:MAG: hypothetical protein V4494_03540 [Chlamydiota bacterium]
MFFLNGIPTIASISNIAPQPQIGMPVSQEKVTQLGLNHLANQQNSMAAYNSVMEFVPNLPKCFIEHNINNITDLLLKITALKTAIKNQNWDHDIFTLTNVNLKNIQENNALEFPFIALAGLKCNQISEEEFFIILCYYGLRCIHEKQEIIAHPLFNTNTHIAPNIALLISYFVEGLKIGLTPLFQADVPDFSLDTLMALFRELEQLSHSPEICHILTLFSAPDFREVGCSKALISQHPGKESEDKLTLWDSIRTIPMHIFYQESRQFIPSLKIYEVFLKHFLGVSSIHLKPRIGLSLHQSIALDTQDSFNVIVPFPTFYPEIINGTPLPGLESTYCNLFYQGITTFSMSNRTREKLKNIVKQLRDFEISLNLPESLRHNISETFSNIGFSKFNKFKYDESNVLSFLESSALIKKFLKSRFTNPLHQAVLEYMDSLLNRWPRLG